MNKIQGCVFVVLLCILCMFCSKSHPQIISKEIEVKPILNISALDPGVIVSHLGVNPMAVDAKGNYYFVDSAKHRILVYNQDETFLRQIGSMGQHPEGLYYPNSICFYEGRLYVSNESGKNVKAFSPEGKFISQFEIENARQAHSILVHDDQIFMDVKYLNTDTYNQNALITVFNLKGEKVNEFGQIVECSNWFKYLNFNAVYLSSYKNVVTVSFCNIPMIMALSPKGELIYSHKLDKIEEISQITLRAETLGADTPNSASPIENQTTIVPYCVGFVTDNRGHIFYALNLFYDERPSEGILIHFDRQGKILEKIKFKSGDELYLIRGLYIDDENRRFVIGGKNKNWFLFTF